MTTEYYQHVITRSGALRSSMYSAGPSCASVEIARQVSGDLHCRPDEGERIAIVSRTQLPGTWTDSAGNAHRRWERPVIVEILG